MEYYYFFDSQYCLEFNPYNFNNHYSPLNQQNYIPIIENEMNSFLLEN